MENNDKSQKLSANDEYEIDIARLLADFFKLFSKFWYAVAILAVVGAGIAGIYQYISYSPLYMTESTFTVSTAEEGSGTYGYYYSQNSAEQLSNTFPYILQSSHFNSLLLERTGNTSLNGTITASAIAESNMVTMRVTSPDAQNAYNLLNAAMEVYPEAARFVLGEMQFHPINTPELPTEPYNTPVWWQVIGIGSLLGAFVGLGILAVLALFKRTAKTPEDMKEITNLKCLACVPTVKIKARRNSEQKRISVLDERIPYDFSESIRGLAMRIERTMKDKNGKILMITSTVSGEGKSTLSINIAEMLASQGKKVLLIDGDLRRQSLAELLNYQNSVTLGDIFDNENISNIQIKKPHNENFWFIGSTKRSNNPAAVLSHPKFSDFIEYVKESMDTVIIDTPPSDSFQDASIWANYADGICYTVRCDFLSKKKIIDGISHLHGDKSSFLGYIFNYYTQGNVSGYGYGKYGYGRYGYGRYGYGYGIKYGSSKSKYTIE